MARYPIPQKFLLWLVAAIGASAIPLSATGVVEGVVRNATTGSPQPHQAVVLLKLEGGMQSVATVQTDSRGRFRLENVDSSSASPYLLQVTYGGANYFQRVVFNGPRTGAVGGAHDRVEADVIVYESSAKPRDISVDARAVRLLPSAEGEESTRLNVEDWYEVSNRSEPPATLYQGERTFRFYVPRGRLAEPRVSVESPTGMPLTQTAVPSRWIGTDAFGVDYPLKPGRTRIRIAYELNYSGGQAPPSAGQANFTLRSHYPIKSMILLVPRRGVEIAGAPWQAAGEDETSDLRIYSARPDRIGASALRAEEPLQVQVKGLAEATSATAAEETAASPVRRVPNPVAEARWYILGFALFILGVALVHLYRIDQTPRPVAGPTARPGRRQHAGSMDADV